MSCGHKRSRLNEKFDTSVQEKESRRLFRGLGAETANMQMFDPVSVVQVTASLKSLHLSPRSKVESGQEKL